jgi:predicted GIY-YIG superfamily endonuclease
MNSEDALQSLRRNDRAPLNSPRIDRCEIGSCCAEQVCAMNELRRRFVYVLRSVKDPDKHYVGVTADVAERLAAHNNGASPHTARHRPWKVVVLLQFADEQRAVDFEKYLKSDSGRAFAKRHFA